jgi:DMSO/TMAO reductase YedYZ molybdopterin-dependent catalytic subunit
MHADGYTTSLSLEDLLKDNVLLTYKLNGSLLETPLGGPLRLVVPDKYGYKSAMWVERITFTDAKELGYWEKRGYSDTADVWKNDRYAYAKPARRSQ